MAKEIYVVQRYHFGTCELDCYFEKEEDAIKYTSKKRKEEQQMLEKCCDKPYEFSPDQWVYDIVSLGSVLKKGKSKK